MQINEVIIETRIILTSLKLDYKEVKLQNSLPNAFVVEAFGVVLVGMLARDYTQIKSKLEEKFPTYRYIFIDTESNIVEKKYEIIWELMRSGYMRYIRINYPNQFKILLMEHNYSRKIIQKRLKIWGNLKRYKYLVEENKAALEQPINYILTTEPDFFDYMPENI